MNTNRSKFFFILTISTLIMRNSGVLEKVFKQTLNMSSNNVAKNAMKQAFKAEFEVPLINAHTRLFGNGNPTGYVSRENLGTRINNQLQETVMRNEKKIPEQKAFTSTQQPANQSIRPTNQLKQLEESNTATIMKKIQRPVFEPPLINAHHRTFKNGNPTGRIGENYGMPNMYEQMYEARVRAQNENPQLNIMNRNNKNSQAQEQGAFGDFANTLEKLKNLDKSERPSPAILNRGQPPTIITNPLSKLPENQISNPQKAEGIVSKIIDGKIVETSEPVKFEIKINYGKGDLEKRGNSRVTEVPSVMGSENKEIQNFKPENKEIQNFKPENKEIQNFKPENKEIQNFKLETKEIQNFKPETKEIQNFQPETKEMQIFDEAPKDVLVINPKETQLANMKTEVSGLSVPSRDPNKGVTLKNAINDSHDKKHVNRFDTGEIRISNLIPEKTDLIIKEKEQNSLANLQTEIKDLVNVKQENTLPAKIKSDETQIANLNPQNSGLVITKNQQTNLAKIEEEETKLIKPLFQISELVTKPNVPTNLIQIKEDETKLAKIIPENSISTSNNMRTTNLRNFQSKPGDAIKYKQGSSDIIKLDPEVGDVSENIKREIVENSKDYAIRDIENLKKSLFGLEKSTYSLNDQKNIDPTTRNIIKVENLKSDIVDNSKKVQDPLTHNLDFDEILSSKGQKFKQTSVQPKEKIPFEKMQQSIRLQEPKNYQIKNNEKDVSVNAGILDQKLLSLVRNHGLENELLVIPESKTDLAIIRPATTDLLHLKEEPKTLANYMQPESRLALMPNEETRLMIKGMATQQTPLKLQPDEFQLKNDDMSNIKQEAYFQKQINQINKTRPAKLLMQQMLQNPLFSLEYSMMLRSGVNPIMNTVSQTPKMIPISESEGVIQQKVPSIRIPANNIFRTHHPYIQRAIIDGANIANLIPEKEKSLAQTGDQNLKIEKDLGKPEAKAQLQIETEHKIKGFNKETVARPQTGNLINNEGLKFYKFNMMRTMPLHTLFDPTHTTYFKTLFSSIAKETFRKSMKENPYVQRRIDKYDDIDAGIRRQTNTQFEMDHIMNKAGNKMTTGPLGERPFPDSDTISSNYKKIGDFEQIYKILQKLKVPFSDELKVYASLKDNQIENEEEARTAIFQLIWNKVKYLSNEDTLEKFRDILPATQNEATRKLIFDQLSKPTPSERAILISQMEQIFTAAPQTFDQDILLDLPMYNFVLNVEEKCIEIFAIELCDEISGILNVAHTKFGGIIKRDFSLIQGIASQLIQIKYPYIHKYLEDVGVMPGFAEKSQKMHDRLFFLLFNFEDNETQN